MFVPMAIFPRGCSLKQLPPPFLKILLRCLFLQFLMKCWLQRLFVENLLNTKSFPTICRHFQQHNSGPNSYPALLPGGYLRLRELMSTLGTIPRDIPVREQIVWQNWGGLYAVPGPLLYADEMERVGAGGTRPNSFRVTHLRVARVVEGRWVRLRESKEGGE